MLLLSVVVLELSPAWTPDEPWAIETAAIVTVDGEIYEIRLPGGTIGTTRVQVSDTEMLQVGATYQVALVDTGDGRLGLLESPVRLDWLDVDTPRPRFETSSNWDLSDPIPLPFSLNTESWPDSYDENAVEASMEHAIRIWNVHGQSRAELRYGGRTSNTQYGNGRDGSNTTQWDGWHWGTTLAISIRTTVGGEIRDCDLRFFGSNNGGDIDWSTDINGAGSGENAVRHTLVHELGHCVGLSHSGTEAAIMWSKAPSDQGPASWVLHSDDIAGIQFLYGAVSADLVVNEQGNGEALDIVISNEGDGTAFDVVAELTGGLELSVELGDIAPGSTAGLTEALGDACGSLETTVTLTDALGNTWDTDVELALQACTGDNPADPGGESGAGGCGCSQSSPSGWFLLPLVGLMLRRRR